jgi:hypothetical protein
MSNNNNIGLEGGGVGRGVFQLNLNNYKYVYSAFYVENKTVNSIDCIAIAEISFIEYSILST